MEMVVNDDKTAIVTVNGQAATGSYALSDTEIVLYLSYAGQAAPGMVGTVSGVGYTPEAGENFG
jgi:hypothetical protein